MAWRHGDKASGNGHRHSGPALAYTPSFHWAPLRGRNNSLQLALFLPSALSISYLSGTLRRLGAEAERRTRDARTDMAGAVTRHLGDGVLALDRRGQSVINLGHNLGLQVVAEDVETEEMRDRLAELGCDVAQGHFLGRLMPPEDVCSHPESPSPDRGS